MSKRRAIRAVGQTREKEDTLRTWLQPPPGENRATKKELTQGDDDSHFLAPIPSGIYGVLDERVDDHLKHFLTKQKEDSEDGQQSEQPSQPPPEILFIRMPQARRSAKEKQSDEEKGDAPATSSSSSSSSGSALAFEKSEFNWTRQLEGEGWHWLWFKYGPALAQLLNTTLKAELAIWMTPPFDEEKLDEDNRKDGLLGPVLFTRKPDNATTAMDTTSESSGRPVNLKLAAHSHPLVFYARRSRGSFRCKVCKKKVSGQCYACDECDWECCIKCFEANGGYNPNPKPAPNPYEEEELTAEDFLYSSHKLPLKPSFKFNLFEQAAASSSLIDDGLLSFHQVLRWLHQQLGSDSKSNFDLDAALKASSDLEQKSQLLRQGIMAALELKYVAQLFPDVWWFLHPSIVSKCKDPFTYRWSIEDLADLDLQVDHFIRTMDPTIGLEQVDLQETQTGVQKLQELLIQLNAAVRSRYYSSSSLRFLPRSQLLELLKQEPSSDQNRLGWNLKARINQLDFEEQHEQHLIRCNLAILSRALQSAHLPFSLLAICPDPDPSMQGPKKYFGPNSLWAEFGDGASERFNESSGFFIPSNVNAVEAVSAEFIAGAQKWETALAKYIEDGDGIHEPTPEQLSESLKNVDWAPMCGGEREMKHYNPDHRWSSRDFSRTEPFGDEKRTPSTPLHKMSLTKPPPKKKKSSSTPDYSDGYCCELCGRYFSGSRYTCVEHARDICLDCGRESQIKWLQSIVDGFNTHREQCEKRVICIRRANMPEDCTAIIQTVLEREKPSTSSSSSSSATQVSFLWFDEFDIDRLVSDIWDKSSSLEGTKLLDAFRVELAASQKNVSELIHYFHLSNAFKLAFSEYPVLVNTAVERLASPKVKHTPANGDGEDEDAEKDAHALLYPLQEEIKLLIELPLFSSTSLSRIDSVNRTASSVLQSVHSQVTVVNLGWKPMKTDSEFDTEILGRFQTPIVFGLLGYQNNGMSASTIVQQLLPCLARVFHRYYENESKAGRKVNDDEKVQFWMKDEESYFPDDIWDELSNLSPDNLLEGAVLLLPPVQSQKLRSKTLPTLLPYYNVTYGNSHYANPDDPQEGHDLTLEPVIQAMHRVFRNSAGSPMFDLEAVLRLSAPIQAQSEVFERCIRLVQSVVKLELHNPRLSKQLSKQVGSSMPVDSDEFFKLHGEFTGGLRETTRLMEELEADTMRNSLKPFEQFARLHAEQRREQSQQKKERGVKRKQVAEATPQSSATAPVPVTLSPSVLSFTPTPLQTEQISSILSSLDAEVKGMTFAPFDDATRIPSGGRLSLFRWKKETDTTAKKSAKTKGKSASSSSASSSSVADSSSSSSSSDSSVASEYQWLILIERVLWSPAGGWIGTEVSCCGSEGAAIDRTDGCSLDFLGKSFDKLMGEGSEINPECNKIQLQGKTVQLQMEDPAWFEERGVELEDEPSVTPEEFCRACFGDPKLRPLLFHSDEKLQSFCAGSKPDLRPLLQLYDWNHPSGYSGVFWDKDKEKENDEEEEEGDKEDVEMEKEDSDAESAEDEEKESDAESPPLHLRPSRSKTFQLIAELLVGRAGDDAAVAAALWENKKSELEPGNTHWKYWPDAGAY